MPALPRPAMRWPSSARAAAWSIACHSIWRSAARSRTLFVLAGDLLRRELRAAGMPRTYSLVRFQWRHRGQLLCERLLVRRWRDLDLLAVDLQVGHVLLQALLECRVVEIARDGHGANGVVARDELGELGLRLARAE